jgi:hypothetical protein
MADFWGNFCEKIKIFDNKKPFFIHFLTPKNRFLKKISVPPPHKWIFGFKMPFVEILIFFFVFNPKNRFFWKNFTTLSPFILWGGRPGGRGGKRGS